MKLLIVTSEVFFFELIFNLTTVKKIFPKKRNKLRANMCEYSKKKTGKALK